MIKIAKILLKNSNCVIDIHGQVFKFGDFHFNSKLRFLTFQNEEPIKLSPKENQLFNDHNKKIEETSKIKELINRQLGPFARPNKVYFVSLLPKTRSGKLLRRAIQAVLENKDAGDLTTLEDPSSLEEIKRVIHE